MSRQPALIATARHKRSDMTVSRREQRFVVLVTVCLLIVFGPIKALAYLAPFIFILGAMFYAGISTVNHLIKYGLILLGYAALGAVFFLLMPDFDLINHALFLLTGGCFLVLLYNLHSVATPAVMRRIAVVFAIFLLVEAVFGLVQGAVGVVRTGSFDVSNGDIVRGTIEPDFVLRPSAANPMFAVLISSLLFTLFGIWSDSRSRMRVFIFGLGLLAWVVASVLHTILFFVGSVAIALVLLIRFRAQLSSARTKRLRIFGLGVSVLFVLGLGSLLLPGNFATFPIFLEQTLQISPTSPSEKARATYSTFIFLPADAPLQPVVGIGPGQYSSRASLMRSGEYLTGGTLPLPAHVHPLADRYILKEWRIFVATRPTGGSTYFPYYSWLSLYGEFGLVGVACIVAVSVRAAWIFRTSRSQEFPRLSLAMLVLLFYVLLLGFQDNYWEIPQAVLPLVIMLRLGYSYLLRCRHGLEYSVRDDVKPGALATGKSLPLRGLPSGQL